jgi:hypothetical protein
MFLMPNSKSSSVWPMCKQFQVLYFNLHMPMEFFVFCGTLSQRRLYKVFVDQNMMLKLVYLNKLLTLHISGLHYVQETNFFFCVCMGMTFVCCVLSINLFFML